MSFLNIRVVLSVCSALVLAACGGGGGSSPDPAQSPSPQQLSSIQGTWLGPCDAIRNGQNAVVGSSREVLTISPSTSNITASLVFSENYYNNVSDCTGQIYASITDPVGTITNDGTTTVAGVTAFKVTSTLPPGTPTFSGAAALVPPNGVQNFSSIVVGFGSGVGSASIATTISTNTTTVKLLIAPLASGTAFDVGADSPFDAQGFPTTLLPPAEGRFTKQ
jgi:hypothetical protein